MNRIEKINKDQLSLQIMVLPAILLLLLFKFVPIYGLQLAFKELVPQLGIWGSPFVGLKHFTDFFLAPEFGNVMKNTLIISLLKIVVGFPIPILFALLLNELTSNKAKNIVQGIAFMPRFLSWVVCAGIWITLLSKENGAINQMLINLNLIEDPIHFLGKKDTFIWTLVITETWKDLGWNSIVYFAAILAIDPALFESSKVDGANRLKRILYITIPSIMPTIIIMLIVRVGYILDAGFEQILVFRNPMVHQVSNILDIYVYDTGLRHGRYGYATAVGLFKSLFAFTLVWLTNMLAKKKEMGMWQ